MQSTASTHFTGPHVHAEVLAARAQADDSSLTDAIRHVEGSRYWRAAKARVLERPGEKHTHSAGKCEALARDHERRLSEIGTQSEIVLERRYRSAQPTTVSARQAQASATAATGAHVTSNERNVWLPPALRQHARPLFCAPRTHQSIELHGITLRDHTAYMSGAEFLQGLNPEQLWLGLDFEGRGLRPEQALELAEALRLMALAHMKRVAAMDRGHA